MPRRQVSGCKHFKEGSVFKTSETTHPLKQRHILEKINTEIYTGARPASTRAKRSSLIHPKTVLIP